MWCNEKTKIVREKNWTPGKTKKNKFFTKHKLWHKSKSEILTKVKNLSYLKTENPNFDKTQEIKSRKKIIFDKKSLN